MNEHNLPDGSYIDENDSVCYVKNGMWHREDGPAVELYNGNKVWSKNGRFHREDGPAVELADGHKEWYINDEFYRTEAAYEEALKIWKMNEAMR